MKEIINRIKNNKKITIATSFLLIFVLIITVLIFSNNKNDKLGPEAFKTSAYTYLPKEAYNYVVDNYKKTGVVLRTEKNKKEDEPYLNPDYVKYLTNKKSSEKNGYIPKSTVTEHDYSQNKGTTTNFPAKYDLRNVNGKSYVTSLKDQGDLGLCWDFALTSAFESKVLKSNMYSGSGEIDLSERQIDYARSNPQYSVDIEKNPFYDTFVLNNELGEGGNIHTYLSATSPGISPMFESRWNHPYASKDKYAPEDVWNIEKGEYEIDSAYELPKSCMLEYIDDGVPDQAFVNTIKEKLMENGAVTISIATGDIGKKPYVNYVPKGNEQPTEADGTNYLFYKDPKYQYPLDHEIVIIGWDDNYEHTVCVDNIGNLTDATYNNVNDNYSCPTGTTKTTIQGAWITKNSWGNDISYPYVAYATTKGEYETINSISKRTWDNAYTTEVDGGGKPANFAKGKTKEKINKIKYGTIFSNYYVDIYVKKGSNSDYQLVGTQYISYPGLYTLNLSQDNIMLEDDNFSIKIIDNDTNEDMLTFVPNISVFTDNVDKEIEINIEKAIFNTYKQYQNLVTEPRSLLLNGTSRNLKSNQSITYEVKDSSGNNVTNKFHFYRNYSISNHINTIVGFNNDVSDGIYKVEAKVNNVKYDTFKIAINKDEIPVNRIETNTNTVNLSLTHDKTYQLQPVIYPSNATYQQLIYTSNNENVATVDSNGKITAVGVGSTTITIKNIEEEQTVEITVNVDDSLLKGDISADGTVDMEDVLRLYNHVKKVNVITDQKQLNAGLFVSKDTPTIADVAKLYRIVNGKTR